MPHVVIVGGGFGGLYAAKALRKAPVRVTLLDKTNHHTFQPLLYQVATAGLNPADIAVPIRRALRKCRDCTVLMAEAVRVDVAAKEVVLEDGERVAYDHLVLATGATHSYFGRDEFAQHAPGLKTIDEGLLIRQRIYLAYEEAEREEDPGKRDALLTFVVVGAGPTGVEMAGALAEIARETLAKEFRRIDPSKAKILLLEGGDRVLSSYVPELSEKAQRALERIGVTVRTGALVTNIDADGVEIGGERVAAKTVIWAAGVAASPIARSLGAPLDTVGRVMVTPELSVPGHDEVYVVGDLAHIEEGGQVIVGVAQAAIQSARHAVKNILASIRGEPRTAFRYVDKGSMATIGRAAAVADMHFVKLSGYLAWLAWFAVHILFLIGFRNRVLVILQWAWSYFTYDRGSRIVHGHVLARSAEPAMLPSKRGVELEAAVRERPQEPAEASARG